MLVRTAAPDERVELTSILDAAALQTDPEIIDEAIDDGDALVAVSVADDGTEGAIVGTLVLDGDAVDSVAVRPGRRGQGIGSALVEAALDSTERLVAEFDPQVRPFWESLGFSVFGCGVDDRLCGVRRGVDAD